MVSVAGYVRNLVARRSIAPPGLSDGDTNDCLVCTARTVAETFDNRPLNDTGCPLQRNVTSGYTTCSPSTSVNRSVSRREKWRESVRCMRCATDAPKGSVIVFDAA